MTDGMLELIISDKKSTCKTNPDFIDDF